MKTSLFKKQNETSFLKCLYAQRREYTKSKKYQFLNNFLLLILAILTIVSSCYNIDILTSITCVFCVLILILNNYINKKIIDITHKAASIQQYFDVSLYSGALNNEHNWGEVFTKTEINHIIYDIDESSFDSLYDWYYDNGEEEPIKQVWSCQKQNILWNSSLKKSYTIFYFMLVFVLFISLLIICIINNVTITKIIIIISWIIPFINEVLVKIIHLAKDNNTNSIIIKKEKELDNIITSIDFTNITIEEHKKIIDNIIEIQRYIYKNRENSMTVPNWFYELTKSRLDKTNKQLCDIEKD